MAKFSKGDFKKSRKLMVECVLATDMSKHFAELGKFKTRVTAEDYECHGKDKDLTIHMLFHLADISNPTKGWDVCLEWTELLFQEFFNQGDMERNRGLSCSYLMDRTDVNIAKSQIGFLDIIISPAYQAAMNVLPELEFNLANIDKNKGEWQSRFEEYDKRLEQEKVKIGKI